MSAVSATEIVKIDTFIKLYNKKKKKLVFVKLINKQKKSSIFPPCFSEDMEICVWIMENLITLLV